MILMQNIIYLLHNHILSTINKHAPLKSLSNSESKNLLKPWITKELLESIKLKNKYYHKYIKKIHSGIQNIYTIEITLIILSEQVNINITKTISILSDISVKTFGLV